MYNYNGSFIQIFNILPRSLIILAGAFAGGILAYYTANASKNFAKNSKTDTNTISTGLSNNINNFWGGIMYNTNGQWSMIATDLWRVLPFIVAGVVGITLIALSYSPSKDFIINNVMNITKSSYTTNGVGDKAKDCLANGEW